MSRGGVVTEPRTIGELIAARRRAMGLNQEELADLLTDAGEGVTFTQSQVSKMENRHHGELALPPSWVRALGAVLGAPEEFMAAAGYPVGVAPGWTDDDLVTLRQMLATIERMETIKPHVKELLRADLLRAMQEVPRKHNARAQQDNN
jgi:transcriptional regulator with XRE-family HTH domain